MSRVFAVFLAACVVVCEARLAAAGVAAASSVRVRAVGGQSAAGGAGLRAASLNSPAGLGGSVSLALPASPLFKVSSVQPAVSTGVGPEPRAAGIAAEPSSARLGLSPAAVEPEVRDSAVARAEEPLATPDGGGRGRGSQSAGSPARLKGTRAAEDAGGAGIAGAGASLYSRLNAVSSLRGGARESFVARVFDGARASSREGGGVFAPGRVRAGASSRLSSSAGLRAADNADKPEPSVPDFAAPSQPSPKSPRRWAKAAVWIAAGAAAVAGLIAYGPAVLSWAEAFGENITFSDALSPTSLGIAFAAGLLSFLSPCTLPLIPAYMSYISGMSFQDIKADPKTASRRTMIGSLAFVAGFATVFTLLGATATALGGLLIQYMPYLMKGAGVIVAVMGLHIMGLLQISLLYRQKRLDMSEVKSRSRLFKAFLTGLAFAFGWTPCIGPILAAILGMAAMGDTVWQGIALLLAYSAGLGVPFIAAAFGANRFAQFFNKYKRYIGVGEKVTGGLLVLVGILIFFGGLQQLAGFFGF